MKIVEATWERRNLGRDAWEVTLGREDVADVGKTLAALRDDRFAGAYVCVKMPVGNLKMLHALEDDGFRFLETQFSLIDKFRADDMMDACETAGEQVKMQVVEKDKAAWERGRGDRLYRGPLGRPLVPRHSRRAFPGVQEHRIWDGVDGRAPRKDIYDADGGVFQQSVCAAGAPELRKGDLQGTVCPAEVHAWTRQGK